MSLTLKRAADVLEQATCHGQRLPAAAGGLDPAFDATEFELSHGQSVVVAEMFHFLGKFTLLGSQLGDPRIGLGHPRGQGFPSPLEVGGGGAVDFACHVVILDVRADDRTNLLFQLVVLFSQFGQFRLAVDHLVELLGSRHATLGPEGTTLLFSPLDRSVVNALLAFELRVLLFEFPPSFDPVLLPRKFFVQVVELVERTGARFETLGEHLFGDLSVLVGSSRGILVDFECFEVECFDSFGDRLPFAPALFFLGLQFVESSTARLQRFVTVAQIADARRRHRLAQPELFECRGPLLTRILESIGGGCCPLASRLVRLHRRFVIVISRQRCFEFGQQVFRFTDPQFERLIAGGQGRIDVVSFRFDFADLSTQRIDLAFAVFSIERRRPLSVFAAEVIGQQAHEPEQDA